MQAPGLKESLHPFDGWLVSTIAVVSATAASGGKRDDRSSGLEQRPSVFLAGLAAAGDHQALRRCLVCELQRSLPEVCPASLLSVRFAVPIHGYWKCCRLLCSWIFSALHGGSGVPSCVQPPCTGRVVPSSRLHSQLKGLSRSPPRQTGMRRSCRRWSRRYRR